MFHSFRNYQSIAEQCTRLNQSLRRIAAKEAKTNASYDVRKVLEIAKDNQVPTAQPSLFPPDVLPVSRQLTAPFANSTPPQLPRAITSKPLYVNPQKQFESNSGLYYNCDKPGHFKAEYPEPKKLSQIFEINGKNRFEEMDEKSVDAWKKGRDEYNDLKNNRPISKVSRASFLKGKG
jgi:hypothetical protein